MRLAAVVVALLLAGCAGTPTDATQPLDRACTVSDCFLERDVRDFEVLDPTTLIVYVGAQRCAFKVQVAGTFCDLTFAPELFFRSTSQAETQTDRDVFGRPVQGGTLGSLRICSGDLRIGVDGGPFTESPLNPSSAAQGPGVTQARRFGNERAECRLQSVGSLTDDQVIELYVAHDKVAPPPPMGAGQIEVGEQKEEEEGAAPDAEGASPPPGAEPPAGETGG